VKRFVEELKAKIWGDCMIGMGKRSVRALHWGILYLYLI